MIRLINVVLISSLLLTSCTHSISVDRTASYLVLSIPVKEVVLDNLKSPWSIAFISDTDALITEKGGNLLRVDLASKSRSIVRGFPDDLANDSVGEKYKGGNNGIFDVVLHPDFAENSLIYIAYSAREGTGFTTKVVRAKLDKNTLGSIETIFVATPFTENERYHFGGGMVFGPDRKLYITIGERLFSEADQPPLPIAQDLSDKRGKIYRLNPDGTIPDDNPYFGDNAVPGLYAVGIRAAQGLAVHPETGEIWFSEHGTRQGDEINKLSAGANYGWPIKTTGEYRDENYVPPEMNDRTFTDPVWYWRQTVAPTGLSFYSGSEFPLWQNDLLVPGLSIGSFWRINFENNEIIGMESLFVNDRARTRKVKQSPNGTLYMLTDTHFTIVPGQGVVDNGGPNGQLIRIRNAARR